MYMAPARNPLRRLPVRAYRSPVRNPLPGLGDFAPGAIGPPVVCPGDPSCPGYVSPEVNTAVNAAVTAAMAAQPTPAAPSAPSGVTFTDWLNQNGKTVAWVAGIAVGILLLSKVAR